MNSLKLAVATLACAAPLYFGGCASGAKYVDSHSTETVVSLDQIDIQDWAAASDTLVQSLLNSGSLERLPQPATLAIDRIINNTTQQVDTDFLVKKIRIALMQTGKVQLTNAEGLGEQAVYANQRRAADAAKAGNTLPSQQIMADITLSGKLLENRAQAGSTRQVTYVFQLSLNQISTGLTLWESEQLITKQGKKASVGW